MSKIQLKLGDFVFSDLEIPTEIPFGGAQRLSTKKFLGGARVIDAQGDDPIPLAWSGTILPLGDGTSALHRAQYLNQMKAAGLPLDLSWGELHYRVVILEFLPVYQFYRIPYRISCEILEDKTAPVAAATTPDANTSILKDTQAANILGNSVGDSTLSSLMSAFSAAVGQVQSFVKAAQSDIAAVLKPLNDARQQVQTLLKATETTLLQVSTLGGLIPGNPIAAEITQFAKVANAALQQPLLVKLNSTLGRISSNLNQINSSARVITVAAGNLYDVASREYGAAAAWTSIAVANHLSDPSVSGISTLVIPPNNSTSDGILLA
jgi:hypothetical protein